MVSAYKHIGDCIHLVDKRNTDSAITELVGLTVDKKYIPSVANIIGTDLSKYKIISNKQFACSLMQVSRDGKMPVAMYKGESAIMSPAYPMFEVNDENEVMPEYLHMYLSRNEFDREAVFYAVGGVRGSLDWEDFCNMSIPVPPISEQRRIVSEYQTVERRIANNERLIKKLEETAGAIYHHTFVEGIDENNLPEGWRKGNLFDICTVLYGYPFDSELFTNDKTQMPLIRIRDIIENVTDTYTSEKVDEKYIIRDGEILIGMDGGFHMTIWSGGCAYQNQRTVRIICDKEPFVSSIQVHKAIAPIIKSLESSIEGTTVAHLSDKHMRELTLILAPSSIQKEVYTKFEMLKKNIILAKRENNHLRTLLSLLTSKLS